MLIFKFCILTLKRAGHTGTHTVYLFLSRFFCLAFIHDIFLFVFLGQNVNSYRDDREESVMIFGQNLVKKSPTDMAKGFKTIYKSKVGGLRFEDLLQKVSEIDPECRIRFTSPHPKDFPDQGYFLDKKIII